MTQCDLFMWGGLYRPVRLAGHVLETMLNMYVKRIEYQGNVLLWVVKVIHWDAL